MWLNATAYFLNNVSDKNYQNWLMYVEVMQLKVVSFFETPCI